MKNRSESHDWRSTPLGPMEVWPEALKVTCQIIMSSRSPMFIWWGPELINIYNDACAPMLGNRHPAGFGRPAAEVWHDLWDFAGKQADLVIRQHQATSSEEMLLLIGRSGYIEETYFSWSYSPIEAGTDSAAGLFCAVTEDTARVIGRRRQNTLRELAAQTADLRSRAEVFAAVIDVIGRNPYDIPFALFYEVDAERKQATLAGAAGAGENSSGVRGQVALDKKENPWSIDLRSDEIQLVSGLDRFFDEIPRGPWPAPPAEALVVPFGTGTEAAGFMVAGISSYRKLDDDYRGFQALVARHIGAAVSNAHAHEEERRRAEALAEIDRAKAAFFSKVTHEFRRPLTLLLGPLEDVLANRYGVLPLGASASLTTAVRSALRLLKLVSALLDFSRIEEHREEAFYQPVDLADVTSDLAINFRPLCETAGLRLEVHCPPLHDGEQAYVDREMWEKIVLHLLSNAFKFTLEGKIKVRLEVQDGQAVLTVSDTGAGIPAEELPRIFERFHRIEHSRGRTNEGTGIGLALVAEFARLHGGTVAVESVEGQGSTFRVAIPLGKQHLNPDRVVQEREAPRDRLTPAAFIEEAKRWLPDALVSDDQVPEIHSHVHEGGPAAGEAQKKIHILWADENTDMRAYVSRVLSRRFNLEIVTDGNAALEAARERTPDLILADVTMPGLDGFGLLRRIRSDAKLSDVPVILLSARAGEEARIEGLEAGADDYLTKPFNSRELLAVIESHLKVSGLRREAKEALRQAEGNALLLASIVESSDDAIISKDLDGIITSWNKGAERLFGYTAEEAVGQSITILIPPERLDEEPRILAALRRGERVDHFETVRVRKNGTRLNISLTISPLKDTRGKIVGASKVARDITLRIQQDLALKQANTDLQQFAYSVSHDLQEPLRMLTAYSELLGRNFGEKLGETGAEFIRYIVEASSRMQNLLHDLRIYTQASSKDQEPAGEIDAEEIANKALQNLDAAIRESGATIHFANLPRVRMHAFQLEQVFQNLIGNAIHYRGSKTPHIEISAAMHGKDWLFSVRDNGIGIAPEFHEQIFGIFKRLHTESEYPGTGMGLAICQRIIERGGGRIWVESEPGKGSTFYFTVPCGELEREGPNAEEHSDLAHRTHSSIAS